MAEPASDDIEPALPRYSSEGTMLHASRWWVEASLADARIDALRAENAELRDLLEHTWCYRISHEDGCNRLRGTACTCSLTSLHNQVRKLLAKEDTDG